MHNYFITGLPRTRTSWLANLFTIGNSYCFHELSKTHKDYISLREELMNRPEEYKGVSDCMLPYYYEPLADTLREQRLVIITRPFGDVVNSLTKWLRSTEFDAKELVQTLDKLERKIEYMKGKYDCKIVRFKDLDDREVVESLWYYCVPGVTFDSQRWEMLSKMQMQPFLPKWEWVDYAKNIKSIMGVS